MEQGMRRGLSIYLEGLKKHSERGLVQQGKTRVKIVQPGVVRNGMSN